MHRPSLARSLVTMVAAQLRKAVEILAMPTEAELEVLYERHLARSPRNRAEARRLHATKGRVARAGGGASPSPLLSQHRRIARDRARQVERAAAGRHAWV